MPMSLHEYEEVRGNEQEEERRENKNRQEGEERSWGKVRGQRREIKTKG